MIATRRHVLISSAAGLLLSRPSGATPVQVAVLIRQLVGDSPSAEGKVNACRKVGVD